MSFIKYDDWAKNLPNQLYRANGSISLNIAEGDSIGTGIHNARIDEYSLGSHRKVRDWYYNGRHIPGNKILDHLLSVFTKLFKLLPIMVPGQRYDSVNKPTENYFTGGLNTPILNLGN